MGSGRDGSAEDRDSAMEFVGGCWEGEGRDSAMEFVSGGCDGGGVCNELCWRLSEGGSSSEEAAT